MSRGLGFGHSAGGDHGAADGGERQNRGGTCPGEQRRDMNLRSHAQPFVSRL